MGRPVRTCGGQTVADHIHPLDNDKPKSNVRGSVPIGQPGAGRPGRIERVVAVAAGAFSVVMLAAILASAPNTEPLVVPKQTQAQPVAERGDPVLGQQLAEQAQQAVGSDPQATLRLLLAAHAVAPDRATHRIALAQAMLGAITPVRLIEARLDAGGSITYAALSTDASFLVTSGSVGGRVWQTGSTTGPARVRLASAATPGIALGTVYRRTDATRDQNAAPAGPRLHRADASHSGRRPSGRQLLVGSTEARWRARAAACRRRFGGIAHPAWAPLRQRVPRDRRRCGGAARRHPRRRNRPTRRTR